MEETMQQILKKLHQIDSELDETKKDVTEIKQGQEKMTSQLDRVEKKLITFE